MLFRSALTTARAACASAASAVRLQPSRPAPAAELRPALRLAAFGGDADAIHALGLAALDDGQPAEARTLFQRALAAGGAGTAAEGPLRNDLGVARAALGDVAAARASVARGAERSPALAAAQENLRALSAPPQAAPAAEGAGGSAPAPERDVGHPAAP